MCDIAPFQMECEFEEHKRDLMVCACAHLNQAFNSLLTEIPIVRYFVQPYHCGAFRVKEGGGDEC